MELAFDGPLKLGASVRFGFSFHWLREPLPGKISGDLGLPLDTGACATLEIVLGGSFTFVLSHDSEGWSHLGVLKRQDAALRCASQVSVRATMSSPVPQESPELAAAMLAGGATDSLLSNEGRAEIPSAALDMSAAVHQKAPTALAKEYSAQLSYRYETAAPGSVLIDCSFDSSYEGRSALEQALAGDFSQLQTQAGTHVRLRPGILTRELSRQTQLELHLPFLDRKEWGTRWEVLAKAEVASDDGRLFLLPPDPSEQAHRKNTCQNALLLSAGLLPNARAGDSTFTLGYTDRRRLHRAQARSALRGVLDGYDFQDKVERWLDANAGSVPDELEASLSLTIGGDLASAWFEAPGDRDPSFFPVYAAVSVAIQQALRRWLPYIYFSDLNRYQDPLSAYPLLVYQSIPPFPGKPKWEFTYDLMDSQTQVLSRRSTVRELAARLEPIHQLLIAVGKTKTAWLYRSDRAAAILATVGRRPRLLNALEAAETVFVDAFVRLGMRCCEYRQEAARDPRKALQDLAKFAGEFGTPFHRRLRHFYTGQDLQPLASLLLVEATKSLNTALGRNASIAAVLRIASGELEQTFVNSHFRR